MARLGRPRGLKGELYVAVYSGGAQRLLAARRVFVERAGGWTGLDVADAWEHNGKPVVRFTGFGDMSAAETLRGLELWVPERDAQAGSGGTWHQYEVLGLRLVDEQGRERGVIEERIPGAGHGWWRVRGGKRTFLFPEVPETVLAVDRKAGVARVMWTEGLDELDAD